MKISSKINVPESEIQEIVCLIDDFWVKMSSWENDCRILHDKFKKMLIGYDDYLDSVLSPLRKILYEFAIPNGEFARLKSYWFGTPPDYDTNEDQLIGIHKKKAGYVLEILRGGDYPALFQYELKRVNGILRLVDKRVMIDDDEKVVSGL